MGAVVRSRAWFVSVHASQLQHVTIAWRVYRDTPVNKLHDIRGQQIELGLVPRRNHRKHVVQASRANLEDEDSYGPTTQLS